MNWQARADDFARKHDLHRPADVCALDLMSEVGEVAKEILLATDYGRREAEFREDLAGELGDVLYSLCLLASSAGVDLEMAFMTTLEKYERRWQAKGNLESGD